MHMSRVPALTGEWECNECGHVEEGLRSKRPGLCPHCKAPADSLTFFAYDDDEDVDEDEWEDELEYEDEEDEDYEDLDEDEYDDDY